MVEEISKHLKSHKYHQISSNIQQLNIYYKLIQDEVYAICMIDDSNRFLVEQGQYDYLLRQVKAIFLEKQKACHLIGVVVTNDISRTKEVTEGFESRWLVDKSDKKLIIFENEPNEFLDLKKCIENALVGKKTGNIGPFTFSPINTILIIINIIVFVLTEWNGDTTSAAYMFECGAIQYGYFITHPQFWRLISSAFLHFGIAHLFNNMLVLAYIGDNLERVLGRWKYLLLYFVSAVGSNLISVYWYQHTGNIFAVSAGASGAIFGVVGALLYILIRNNGRLDDINSRQLILMIAFTIFHGITTVEVNNSAHIGGIIVGFICAMLLYRRPSA
ncbi:MAG: rhomboid family intramembrane serine protease [Lachnospiraceae bacterium]